MMESKDHLTPVPLPRFTNQANVMYPLVNTSVLGFVLSTWEKKWVHFL